MNARRQAIKDIKECLKDKSKQYLSFREEPNIPFRDIVLTYLKIQRRLTY